MDHKKPNHFVKNTSLKKVILHFVIRTSDVTVSKHMLIQGCYSSTLWPLRNTSSIRLLKYETGGMAPIFNHQFAISHVKIHAVQSHLKYFMPISKEHKKVW